MKSITDATPSFRFVAFDLHKHDVVVAAVNRDQEVVLEPRRLSIGELAAWAKTNLRPTGQVVIQATSSAWTMHDPRVPYSPGSGLCCQSAVLQAETLLAARFCSLRPPRP